MKIVTCNCKFCKREIEMEVDERGLESPMLDVKLWLKNVACNRCAEFYTKKSRIAESIGKECLLLINSKADQTVSAIVEKKLTVLTKNLCKIICDFKYLQFTWDVEFVNMLMMKPHSFSRVINLYCNGLNNLTADRSQ